MIQPIVFASITVFLSVISLFTLIIFELKYLKMQMFITAATTILSFITACLYGGQGDYLVILWIITTLIWGRNLANLIRSYYGKY